jgi:antagonist of KipI
MDPVSHRVANALVGNGADAATLEVTLLGPELEFDAAAIVAVAGADFALALDERPAPMYEPLAVRAGSRLRFGARAHGARAYVAVSGGITTPAVFGSRATHLISAMGGLGGRALKAGDRIPFGAQAAAAAPSRSRADAALRPVHERPAPVRVLAGPQVEFFADGALDALQSAPYIVGAKSDRMGFRLEGPVLAHSRGADTISDATPLGALQVPASGQPILLMADRQTTGGYPKIATVIAADLGVAGQLGPGDALAFVVCNMREAMAALIAQERALMAIGA